MIISEEHVKKQLFEDIQHIEQKYCMYKSELQGDTFGEVLDKIIRCYLYGFKDNSEYSVEACLKDIKKLRPIIYEIWSNEITDIDKFENGKPFKLLVAEKNNAKYFDGYYYTSLITDKSIDKVRDKIYLSFGKNEDNDKIYIQFEKEKGLYDITTPDILEKENAKNQYMEANAMMPRSSLNSILFVSNGCDFLFDDYMKIIPYLCESNLDIKVLNKDLYCKQKGYSAYTENDYKIFKERIDRFKDKFSFRFDQEADAIINHFLNDIVIPMKYDQKIEKEIIEALKEVNPSTKVDKPKQKRLS